MIPNDTDETVTIIETEAEPALQPSPEHQSIDIGTHIESIKLDDSTDSLKSRDMSIGSIYDQFLIEYVVRLVCYKFLLTSQEQKLKSDSLVRVSIKNLSLIVLSDSVRIHPQILLMKLTVPRRENVSDECVDKMFDDLSELCLPEKSECKDDELLLDIIPDHFGTSTCSLEEFLSPLSDSTTNSKKSSNEKYKGPFNTAVITNVIVTESHDTQTIKCEQNVDDSQCGVVGSVLLYFNHHDPSLRGNVQSIIGNFIVSVLENYRNVDEFRKTFAGNVDHQFINFDLLLKVLMQVIGRILQFE